MEVDIRPTGGKGSNNDPEDLDAWEVEISKAGLVERSFTPTAVCWKAGMWEAEYFICCRDRWTRESDGMGQLAWLKD